jgi:hypothetical protein
VTIDDVADAPLATVPLAAAQELLDGELVEQSSTPGHQDLVGEVWLAVRRHCRQGFLVSMHQPVRVDRRNVPRPAIVVTGLEHYGSTPVPASDVVLAIDIVSEPTPFASTMERAKLYASGGIARYWLIDQSQESMWLAALVLDPGSGRYRFGPTTTDAYAVADPWPISIDLPRLSARRAALLDLAAKQMLTVLAGRAARGDLGLNVSWRSGGD